MSDEANTEPKFAFPKEIVTAAPLTLNQIWGNIIKPFTAIAPTNSAFIDATISWEDIGNGYTLDYNSNGILWRVNAAGIPHPDDLEKFYEQQEIIQGYSDNLSAKLKSNKNLDKIGIDDAADISEGSSKVDNNLFEFNLGGYGFRIVDDREKQKVRLATKVQEWAHGMEFLGSGYSAGGLVSPVKTIATKMLTVTERVTQESSKAEELAQFAKLNEVKQLPVNFDKILEFSSGNMDLAKRLLLSTKEAIPGKPIPELVETFKLTETPAAVSLSGYQTRIWYKWQESFIGSKLDYSKPLEEVARDAFNMRNSLRTTAREAMTDTEWSKYLMSQERNKTFEQLVAENMEKGLSGDALWNKIIESSMKSRDYVDKLFGL